MTQDPRITGGTVPRILVPGIPGGQVSEDGMFVAFPTPQIDVDPNVIGSAEFGDIDLNFESPLSPLQPHHLAFADKAKSRRDNVSATDSVMDQVRKGKSLDEIEREARQSKADELLTKTAGMDDAQFESILRRMQGLSQPGTPPPALAELRKPNNAQAIAAALGALLQPRFAANIAATPFQEQLRMQALETETAQNQFQQQEQLRQSELRALQDQLEVINRRQIAAANNEQRAADREARMKVKLRELAQKLPLEQWSLLTRMGPEMRRAYAAQIMQIKDAELLDAIGTLIPQEQLTNERVEDVRLDNKLAEAINPFKVANEEKRGVQMDANIAYTNERAETERRMRPAKLREQIAKTGIAEKELEVFDDEFAQRAAIRMAQVRDANSRVAKRNLDMGRGNGPGGSLTPQDRQTLNAEKSAINSLISVVNAQLKSYEAQGIQPGDPERKVLDDQLAQYTNRLTQIAAILGNGGGLPSPNGLDVPMSQEEAARRLRSLFGGSWADPGKWDKPSGGKPAASGTTKGGTKWRKVN